MNGKEALQKLRNYIPLERSINSEKNKVVNECINIIDKELDQVCKPSKKENPMNGEQLAELVINSCRQGEGYGFKECLEQFITLKNAGSSLEDIEYNLKNKYLNKYYYTNLPKEG